MRAPADGHTLLMVTLTNAINVAFYDKLNYDFIRDITPIAGVIRSPFVLEVHPAVPVKTVSELIAHASCSSRIRALCFEYELCNRDVYQVAHHRLIVTHIST